MVSWYGAKFQGKLMANGHPFNKDAFSFAHKTLPFGTKVRFCLHAKCAEATLTDRGPYIKGREFDVSEAVADAIGLKPLGVAPVQVTYLSKPDKLKSRRQSNTLR